MSKHYCIVGLALLILVCGVFQDAAAQNVYQDSTWSTTVYYRSIFYDADSGPKDGLIRIAAVHSCEVYFNGELLGSNPDWTSVQEFAFQTMTGKRKSNHIAVKVANNGTGAGNGLVAEVEIEGTLYPGGLDRKTIVWRWTGETQDGDDWLTADVSKDVSWHFVQSGNMDLGRVAGLESPETQAIAGYPGGVDASTLEGRIVLRKLDGENLALGQRAYDENEKDAAITDGRLDAKSKAWAASNAFVLNDWLYIDLIERRKVSQVKVITYAKDPEDYQPNSLQGYSIRVSDDNSSWTEVAVLHGITQYEETEVSFPPIYARYIGLMINESDNVNAPVVGEVEVYGPSIYASEGAFTSGAIGFGSAEAKNFGAVTWEAEVPEGTSLSLQFRTGNSADPTDASWSAWSETCEESGGLFSLPEPRTFVQYRVNLSSTDDELTPVFKGIAFDYDTEDLAATEADGSVTPTRVSMGEPTSFVYKLHVVPTDKGIKRVEIATPSYADSVTIDEIAGYDVDSGPDRLTITLAAPITSASNVDTLTVRFRSTLYAATHPFRAFLFTETSQNPLGVMERQEEGCSWTVVVTDAVDDVLSEVKANPQVFSPNNDGVCDYTVIEFILAKVEAADVDLKVFDRTGALVRDLDVGSLSARVYAHPLDNALAVDAPGYWDGKDDDGELVPPGVYIYRVKLDLDGSDESASGTVVVAY